jgi:hypothetical protein
MKLIKFMSIISAIYFAILMKIYSQEEGKMASLMAMLLCIMFFVLSSVLDKYEEDKKDNNDSNSLR